MTQKQTTDFFMTSEVENQTKTKHGQWGLFREPRKANEQFIFLQLALFNEDRCLEPNAVYFQISELITSNLKMPVRESEELKVKYGRKTTSATCQPSKCLWKSSGPLTCGQSSPSSGVISVSLCTTTLVTDMSGCCSLASLIAWASAYPKETTEGQKQKGGGTCMISSKVERFMTYYTIYKWGKWLKYEIYHHWFNYYSSLI